MVTFLDLILLQVVSRSHSHLGNVEDSRFLHEFLFFLSGSLMVVAWIGTASVAIFLARYYKDMWPEKTHCKVKIWFAVSCPPPPFVKINYRLVEQLLEALVKKSC